MIKLSSLKPLENNPFKKRDDDQIKKIGESIKSFERMMSIRKIIIDEDNEILGGNKRFFALKKLGYKEIPDEWVDQVLDLSEEQKKEFIVKDNSHWGSEWDYEMLKDWGVDLDAWGVGDIEWGEDNEDLEAKEDGYEIPDEIETDIVLGDLFEIGEHRLLCGDSTDSDMVAKLMNGKKADMVFTDPPYDIDIDYKNILLFSENCNVFIFNNDRAIIRQLKKSPLEFKKFFVFYHSGTAIPQEGGNEVFLDHVLVSHEINGNPKVRYNKGNGTRTVIKGEYRRAEEHKHQKPVSFLSPIIEGYSNVDFIILDLFAGGGNLFSVAHQLKRKCYGMELDPKYCQVIIDRMKKLDSNLTIKKNGNII